MTEPSINQMLAHYRDSVVPRLMTEFAYANRHQVPKLERITVNMGLGEAVQNAKLIELGQNQLAAITGQKPVVTRAKKSIAGFKLREGMPVGVMVTLRRERMWEFLERLVVLALPRVRDFKGISRKAFDGRGNYTLGVREQIMFPEIDYDKVEHITGMNICFATSAVDNASARALLQGLGLPFRKEVSS